MAVSRDLTERELAALSDGLVAALSAAGARPRIVSRAFPLAWVAWLWRGSVPIMAVRRTIWWPDAPDELSAAGRERQMSLLQHELQHVLEYATGQLTELGYALDPANWRYAYPPLEGMAWADLGAEQRAQVVQDYWLAERGLLPGRPSLDAFRRIIPWAV